MNTVIRYAAAPQHKASGPFLRLFRALFLLGVWVLVGLAGLAVWSRLVT